MKIASYFNTTQDEIDSRKWNPYLGISINNKVFTGDYLLEFMNWAAIRAKDRVAIIIVDIIQRINNEILDRSKPIAAIEKAFRKADEVRRLCSQAQSMLTSEKNERLVILEWTDIIADEYFSHNLNILKEAYAQDERFKKALAAITKRNLGAIIDRLNDSQVEILSRYLLNELPELITGFRHDGIHYNLNVYPGKITSIYSELLKYDFFQPILAKLRIIGKNASVEAY